MFYLIYELKIQTVLVHVPTRTLIRRRRPSFIVVADIDFQNVMNNCTSGEIEGTCPEDSTTSRLSFEQTDCFVWRVHVCVPGNSGLIFVY